MRRGVIGLSLFAVVMVYLPWIIPPAEAQELPLELRWSTTCPDTISKARLTDLDDDGQTEFAYTSVLLNVCKYLRVYQITPDELSLIRHDSLPTPDDFWPYGEFDLKDINDDHEFDVLVGYGMHRLYILYGPDFTVGNYHVFRTDVLVRLTSVDVKLDCHGSSVVACRWNMYQDWGYYVIYGICNRFILPDFGNAGGVDNWAMRHFWEGIDNFSREKIYLFSNYRYFYSWDPYAESWEYGFTITDEDLITVDGQIWYAREFRAMPLCFAGQLDSDSEIEFLFSQQHNLRCYDLREGDLELQWYRENTADDYLSALDVTGDGIEEAIVANSEGQIWAIEGEYGNTIAAGSIGHQVSNMFFTKHQETGRNLLICYQNSEPPILYLYEIGTPTGIDDDKSQQSKPKDFILKQNYPNPFNSRTQIEYSLNKDGEVSLQVFDLAGSLVATLQEGRKQAGKHVIEWNGEDSASGIYFYRLTSGESTQTRKMILLK